MQYIINQKLLSIPPYISTTWESITSLHVEQNASEPTLVVQLKSGLVVKIPSLNNDLLTKIFTTHSQYLDTSATESKTSNMQGNPFNFDALSGFGAIPMKFGVNLEGLGNAMQHDPSQANSPDLPKEVIEKISAVAKIMDAETNLTAGLKAEPHCNCIHCQIARAVHGETAKDPESIEEEVSDEDLRFKTWDIDQTGDKLYTVTNPLDKKEQYNVYLGEPLGCTCGQKNCEHIKAVLNT